MRAMRRHHCTRQKTVTAAATTQAHTTNVWRPTRRMKLQFKVINTCSVGAKSQLSCKACAVTDSAGKGSNNADASCAVPGKMRTRMGLGDWTAQREWSLPHKDDPPLSVCPFVSQPFWCRLYTRRSSHVGRSSFFICMQNSNISIKMQFLLLNISQRPLQIFSRVFIITILFCFCCIFWFFYCSVFYFHCCIVVCLIRIVAAAAVGCCLI